MALKSGQMARLNVQSPAIFAAQRFLNSVQNQDGSQYGYQSRKPRPDDHGRRPACAACIPAGGATIRAWSKASPN